VSSPRADVAGLDSQRSGDVESPRCPTHGADLRCLCRQREFSMSGASDARFLDARYRQTGTRFRIYPQPRWLKGVGKPAVIYVNAAPHTIQSGPEDERIYVVDARKKTAYVLSGGHPPYPRTRSSSFPRVRPDRRGHFANLRAGSRAFSSAMIFATVRSVLEIWERYFGREIPWPFRDAYPRLELIPRAETVSAWSQYGYIECGFWDFEPGKPLAENFDVVAHETAHSIVHQVIGEPPRPKPLQYRALDEGLADVLAVVSLLHFETVVDRLLVRTRGNLFSVNVLSRIGETSRSQQIRKVFNDKKMSTLKWDPDPDGYKYCLALPFTGGTFDVLVEIYQQALVRRRAITHELANHSYTAVHRDVPRIQREFSREFRRKRGIFKDALLEARDYFGRLLARTLDRTSMRDPSYPAFVANMLEADAELSGGAYRRLIRESFVWREVLPDPSKRRAE